MAINIKEIDGVNPAVPLRNAIGDGTYHPLSERFANLGAAQAAFPDMTITTLTESIDWAAVQWALKKGEHVIVPKGDYIITQELEMITPGQVLSFENMGGYADGDALANWKGNTRFIASAIPVGETHVSNFRKANRIHRIHRSASTSPTDPQFSTVINVQAEGVVLEKVCIWLKCDYTDTAATNLGDEVDVGVFVGTRVGFQARDLQVLGYFRLAGLYLDVSSAYSLHRSNSRAGDNYDQGTIRNGGDGTHLINPYIRGARQGLAILGGKLADGAEKPDKYFDVQRGEIEDSRGSVGFSDFLVLGGRIFGPDHHSNRRLKNPNLVLNPEFAAHPELNEYILNAVSLQSEPDDAPAAVHIDGIAGNGSGCIWGLRFVGTRIASFEAFRLRLGRVDRLSLVDCFIDGRDSGRMDTSGQSISTNDYILNSYGDIAAESVTKRVKVYGSHRTTDIELAPHFYSGVLSVINDDGNMFNSGYIAGSSKDVHQLLDLRAPVDGNILFRVGAASKAWLSDLGLRILSGLQLGSDTGVRIDSGLTSPEGVILAAKGSLYLCTAASGGLYVKETASGNTGWVKK